MKKILCSTTIVSLVLLGFCLAVPSVCHASLHSITDLAVSEAGYDSAGFYVKLSWTATTNDDPIDFGAQFLYYLYSRNGRDGLSSASLDSQCIATTSSNSYSWHPSVTQDYMFMVIATETFGLHVGDSTCSNTAVNHCPYGLYGTEGTNGASWSFPFSLRGNAYVNVRIYAPGAILNQDTYGHTVHDAAYNSCIRNLVVKQLMSYGSQSASWNCKDDTGTYVTSGNYLVLVEAILNDTEVIGSETVTASVNVEIGQTVHTYPNPSKGQPINFEYIVGTAPAEITIEVYTITGELVWTNTYNYASTGTKTEMWNCLNSSGCLIGSDIYVYRIIQKVGTDTTIAVKKLIYVR
ncbi:hypothetical protein AUJ67_06880 [Candidatus Desantisbacteria bacterium CG1_02_49_89]|nr:MAG: hypothetical protein AUJ67_06880 [Candidatus Desantisbacteria bacterium CG1_02_49_89]PJB27352.1 MAG: hypothetical protein CO111_05765 [Candidatus Desantisbacteria bacterium CG_4_9_14_3_um_filter_50_7]